LACLNEQIFQILLVYLDDILIFSTTFEEHLERLKMVLKRLRELKLKLEKCTFLRRRVTYLDTKYLVLVSPQTPRR